MIFQIKDYIKDYITCHYKLYAGIIAIYGVVIAVLIAGQLTPHGYTLFQ